jgi:hypothetical protein
MPLATFFKHFDLLAGQPDAVASPGVRPSPVAATSANPRGLEKLHALRILHVAVPETGTLR